MASHAESFMFLEENVFVGDGDSVHCSPFFFQDDGSGNPSKRPRRYLRWGDPDESDESVPRRTLAERRLDTQRAPQVNFVNYSHCKV